jgi:hypothetical protein
MSLPKRKAQTLLKVLTVTAMTGSPGRLSRFEIEEIAGSLPIVRTMADPGICTIQRRLSAHSNLTAVALKNRKTDELVPLGRGAPAGRWFAKSFFLLSTLRKKKRVGKSKSFLLLLVPPL